MINKRALRGGLFGLSLLFFLTVVLIFEGTHKNTCLGLPFRDAAPDQSQYVYRDYSRSLEFHGEKAAVDVETSTIYIPQSLEENVTAEELKGNLVLKDSLNAMYFVRDPMFADLAGAAAEGHGFTLIISSGKSFMRYRVVFTTLPVLRIEDPDQTELTEKFVNVTGSMCLWTPKDPDVGLYTVKKSGVRWKIRGQTAASLPKKSWKLTLVKKTGVKRNMALLGLGSDDDWILNPMSMDDTKTKEQFTMELWNELADRAEWDTHMSTGAYCEVVMNGQYRGLYLLQRRVDRKYLKLKKDQILLKANGGPFAAAGKKESYEIISSPFSEEETYDIWLDLFHNRLGNSMDLNNFSDISIFVQLGFMQDNAGFRNLFCLLTPQGEDYRLSYVLWDTDMAMGMCLDFIYDYDTAVHTPLLRHEHDMIRESIPDLDQEIAARWFRLREGLLSEAHMDELLEDIEKELAASGAMARDREKWGLSGEAEKPIAQFLHDRLIFLDNYYSGKLA